MSYLSFQLKSTRHAQVWKRTVQKPKRNVSNRVEIVGFLSTILSSERKDRF